MKPSRAALLCFAICNSCCGGASPHSIDAPLKVMTFNIRYCAAHDGDNAWEHRREFVADVILEAAPDLIGLQEVCDSQAGWLVQALGDDYRLITRATGEDEWQGVQNAIFIRASRFELLERGQFWLSTTPELPGSDDFVRPLSAGRSAGPRMVLWVRLADLENEGRVIDFANTHVDGAVAEQAFGVLRDFALDRGGVPLILAGDFNTFPFTRSEAPEWLRPHMTDAYPILVQDGLLVDAFAQLHPHNREPSGCGWEECAALDFDARIDWILHTPDLIPMRAAILVRRRNGRNVSDHWPVVVELGGGEG